MWIIYLAAVIIVFGAIGSLISAIIAGAAAAVESTKELGIGVRDPSLVERKGTGPPIKTLKQLQHETKE